MDAAVPGTGFDFYRISVPLSRFARLATTDSDCAEAPLRAGTAGICGDVRPRSDSKAARRQPFCARADTSAWNSTTCIDALG